MTKELVGEGQLAEMLGVPRKTLVGIRRDMERETDWVKLNNMIWLTKAGSEKVFKELGIERSAESDRTEPIPTLLTLIVKRIPRNPRLLIATDPDGNTCRVKVRTNAKFRRNMQMPCRHVEGDVYELARKCPRWRGRW